MTDKRIDVAAAVITDARGRVLLARRTAGRDLAGLWEFPGGKVEAGESPEQALVRELREELRIEAHVGAPVIAVAQQYPDKRLRLDVRHVTRWEGVPRGLEGQALVWVPREKLASYAMPPADRPVVAALLHPNRYLVTPAPADSTQTDAWLATFQRALDAGVRRVQLRLPGVDGSGRRALAIACKRACAAAGAELLINGGDVLDDSIALSQELQLGLHLRATQLVGLPRRPIDLGLPLAASCHDQDELRAAEALGCDFVVAGPVHATTTHPGVTGIGWQQFEHLREVVSLPIYAIGGLGPNDIATARRHGAQGIAAIRGLWPGV